jgi:hypothetical protein
MGEIMNYIVPATLSVFVLTGCGGGGTLTADIDRDYSSSNEIASEIIKEYSNGDAVIAVKGDLEDGGVGNTTPRYYFVLSEDANAVIDTFDGVVAWERVENTFEDGNKYGVEREGVNAKGQNVFADTVGINLNFSGSEYASLSAVEVNGKFGYLTSGTVISNLPTGRFNYEGAAIIGLSDLIEVDETLLLIADFSKNEVNFTAATENLFASGNDLVIDPETGSFSGEDGTIGERGSTFSIPATALGAFAGINAGGVHGVMYPSEDNDNDGFVVFLGER